MRLGPLPTVPNITHIMSPLWSIKMRVVSSCAITCYKHSVPNVAMVRITKANNLFLPFFAVIHSYLGSECMTARYFAR